MSTYTPKISKDNNGRFYALVVRIDYDGEQNVCHSYRGRHFATHKAALKSTNNHIAKLDA